MEEFEKIIQSMILPIMSGGERLSFTEALSFMFLMVYGVAATLSVVGTIVIGTILSWGTGTVVGYVSILVTLYSMFTMLLAISIMLIDEDLLFYKGWTVEGQKLERLKITRPVECDCEYPDHPLKLTLNGIATRLSRLISQIDGNQVEKIQLCSFEQVGGREVRFQMENTPSKTRHVLAQ